MLHCRNSEDFQLEFQGKMITTQKGRLERRLNEQKKARGGRKSGSDAIMGTCAIKSSFNIARNVLEKKGR
jgi:hypothetical protein